MTGREAIKYFQQIHLEYTGYRYIPNYGRDGNIFKLLLQDITERELKDCIKLYLSDSKPWYSPVAFKNDIQKLFSKAKRQRIDRPKMINSELERYGNIKETDRK